MKTWQSVLVTIGMVYASYFVQKLPAELQQPTLVSIAAIAGVAAKKNSDTNPDGTPASVGYQPPSDNPQK